MQQAWIHIKILTFFALAKEILAGKETQGCSLILVGSCAARFFSPKGITVTEPKYHRGASLKLCFNLEKRVNKRV
ncbi:hypothetical protein F5882DRAFT_38556 [Hyaloscypha sp. PMI_1271]|nr:hypothetical protein F5882DRAFT_38556 [Hyaloscypha sp. PMI_1271]